MSESLLLAGGEESGSISYPDAPHSRSGAELFSALSSSGHGLSCQEAADRIIRYGRNALPRSKPPSVFMVFLHQFVSPLIYVLGVAAVISLLIHEYSDAGFIAAVLLLNAIIGTVQEYSAQQAAEALNELVTTSCRVLRDGDAYEVSADQLVPGDILLLESGDRVPADLRLLTCRDLEVDESLLTGESMAVLKDADQVLEQDVTLGDRSNMVFAGTLVSRGRGKGLVVGTALATELGRIASVVLGKKAAKAPLLIRMEKFTHWVALLVVIAAALMAAVALSRGMPLNEIFLLAVALAVSAIPEGLPVALTVALAIGMRRMAKRNVIVRKLMAVEALGSCTYIATDKTGTLTVNQLTARRIIVPGCEPWEVTGESLEPEGRVITPSGRITADEEAILQQIFKVSVLSNEGFLGHRDGGWVHHGDAVDVALLVLAHKAGITQADMVDAFPVISTIPFESERLYSASLNRVDESAHASVKGALERVLPMCGYMATPDGVRTIDPEWLQQQTYDLASDGYRVIALASGEVEVAQDEELGDGHLQGLTLVALVGMIDPLRPEAKDAVARCRDAGIEVAMVTGDHPATAMCIARELDLVDGEQQPLTGPELKQAHTDQERERLVGQTHVFARVEPQQKLDIVQSLQRSGHFVATSGDGANDAPALRAANVGVAMGKSGTDVARETADLIITDDNFASIVAGVEEGRIAYANVRKVIFLLISTGAAELVLFTMALLAELPLPLLAVQLLWLNLVTNGIQDVALAFEPGEGRELRQKPRPPKELIFNRLMIERVVLSALVIGSVAFLVFQWLLGTGVSVDEARNGTLLLMVLFENIHVFNSRSETLSAFCHNPLRNPLLLFGTVVAQLIHIGAMYTPWIRDVLHIQPVSIELWSHLLVMALTVLLAMEAHKLLLKYLSR
ncbi:MAG: HAD-IC family P-type ATPase [Gammaproteobacteria bacterium]|nr:HAD-IC family P-type ATPase [Gammaproteobacteria bacterium]